MGREGKEDSAFSGAPGVRYCTSRRDWRNPIHGEKKLLLLLVYTGDGGIWYLTACTQEHSSRSRQRRGQTVRTGDAGGVLDWEATSEEEMRVQEVVLILPAVDPAGRRSSSSAGGAGGGRAMQMLLQLVAPDLRRDSGGGGFKAATLHAHPEAKVKRRGFCHFSV